MTPGGVDPVDVTASDEGSKRPSVIAGVRGGLTGPFQVLCQVGEFGCLEGGYHRSGWGSVGVGVEGSEYGEGMEVRGWWLVAAASAVG